MLVVIDVLVTVAALSTAVIFGINRVFIAASNAGETPAAARTLQRRWESVLPLRVALQGFALTAFCVAIAVAAR